jgi:hypothetical protein
MEPAALATPVPTADAPDATPPPTVLAVSTTQLPVTLG